MLALTKIGQFSTPSVKSKVNIIGELIINDRLVLCSAATGQKISSRSLSCWHNTPSHHFPYATKDVQ